MDTFREQRSSETFPGDRVELKAQANQVILTLQIVSLSQGMMVFKSITSHETLNFSCASWATSRKTWTIVPQATMVRSLPGMQDEEELIHKHTSH